MMLLYRDAVQHRALFSFWLELPVIARLNSYHLSFLAYLDQHQLVSKKLMLVEGEEKELSLVSVVKQRAILRETSLA